MELLTPPPMEPGDRVAVIAPSGGGARTAPHVLELGLERLRSVFDLDPVVFPTARQTAEFLAANPSARAADVHAAFEATAPGFSTFAIGADTTRFEVVDWELDATAIELGSPITLTATVENHGRVDAEYGAQLTANGEVVASDTVTIAAGDSRDVSLEFTPTDAGEYELALGDVELGTVTVTETETVDSWLRPVLGLVVLLVVIAGGVVVLRRRFDDSG